MKIPKFMLLFVGISGLTASCFGLANGHNFIGHVITLICGVSLIYGYFQFKNLRQPSCELLKLKWC